MKKILFLFTFIITLKADECALLLANEDNLSSGFNKMLFEASDKCSKSLQNQAATKELYRLANEIRGSNSACAGIHYLSNLQNFKIRLALIALERQKFEDISNFKALQDYFEYWAYQSVGNFKLYKDFWSEYNKALKPLSAYFQTAFKLSSKEASAYAKNALNTFFMWAVGETKIFNQISELQKIAAKNDINELRSYIYTKTPSLAELSLALRAALLSNASKEIIAELLNLGAQINEGYESALFYALFSPENVKFC